MPERFAAMRWRCAAASATLRNSPPRGYCAMRISVRFGRAPATSSRSMRSSARSAAMAPTRHLPPTCMPASTTAPTCRRPGAPGGAQCTRAVAREGADAALAAALHARLDDRANVPQAWRDRLRELTDRAIGFAREVAGRTDNEAEARRATSLLYHVGSAVALAWEGGRIHEMRGDARRLLLSRMVIDHRVSPNDPFRLTENDAQRAITGHLLGMDAVGMAEVGELLVAA